VRYPARTCASQRRLSGCRRARRAARRQRRRQIPTCSSADHPVVRRAGTARHSGLRPAVTAVGEATPHPQGSPRRCPADSGGALSSSLRTGGFHLIEDAETAPFCRGICLVGRPRLRHPEAVLSLARQRATTAVELPCFKAAVAQPLQHLRAAASNALVLLICSVSNPLMLLTCSVG
jgi:hypothetical protein